MLPLAWLIRHTQDLVAVDYGQLCARAEPARLGDQGTQVANVDDLITKTVR